MVATGLPIATAAPQAQKAGQADSANAAAENPEGFADALLQLLGLAEPAAAAPPPVATPLVQALLDGIDEDSGSSSDTDAEALLAMLPLMQPADLRSAPVVRQGAGSPDAIAATGASLKAAVAVALSDAGTRELKALLKEPGFDGAQSQAADSPSQLAPSGALQLLTQETVSTGRAVASDGAASRQLQTQVGTPAWSDELGARLQLMAEKGHHAASLRLSPEHLGPLEVQISVQDDQATVWFGASNVDTRAALEQALPRLRELFAAQGMSLAHSGVFQQSPQAQGQARPVADVGDAIGETEISESTPITVSRGLLDAYA